jgi:glycosyltransferase involved in cell wall biosynthesis
MITTPVGGLAEQVVPFGAGLVAEDLSPDAFAAAMTRLAIDGDLYRTLAARTVAAAEGPMSWDRVAERFEEVIAGL